MLKYVVVAVFSICALPCFVNAQSGSRSVAAPVMATPVMDAPAASFQTMDAPMGSSMMGQPVVMSDMGGMSSDCGCGAAAPVADCGCDAPVADCGCAPRTRKKLVLTKVCKEVTRCKRVCTTDCCGCPKKEWVKVKKTVTRNKLTCVDVPRRERCGCSLGSRMKGLFSGCGCKAQADPCGCEAPVADDCGCGASAPAPVADCGCGS